MQAGRRKNVLRPNFPPPNSPISKHPTAKRPNGAACTEQFLLRTVWLWTISYGFEIVFMYMTTHSNFCLHFNIICELDIK
jgi:hypothetical protein